MTNAAAVSAEGRHRLGRRHFDLLATGGSDAETIEELLRSERSWRLIQLRAVLDAVRAQPDAIGPLSPVQEAWRLLADAERRSPSEVEKVLLTPQVGTWATFALRRLRGSITADVPLWVDIGYLHTLAAAAAIRAGLRFHAVVPVRNGFAFLPTLGAGHLPTGAPWGKAEVVASAQGVTITAAASVVRIPLAGESTDGWVGLPVFRVEAAGHTLTVTLNHLDPYRNLRGSISPERLPPERLQRWETLLMQAWELIVEASPELAVPIGRGLTSVVPQPAAERFRTMSASAGDAFGSTIVSEPEDAPELAVTLVHEFQHIKLGGLLHLTPLHRAEPAQRLYAPWRDDPRPLGGLLQGIYAFVGITEFWRAFRSRAVGPTATLAQFEFARWREQVALTLRRVSELPELTGSGRQFIAGLSATAVSWRDEPVPVAVQGPARAAVADHRTRWRLHHLRPDAAVVSGYTGAWATGLERPDLDYPDPAVEPDPSARRLDTRAVLALWRLTDEDGFARLQKDPSSVGTRVSGATRADLAYTAGEMANARRLYRVELSDEPENAAAWAGLALVEAATDPGGVTACALRERPELVRAVFQELARTGAVADPLAVAAWIGGGVTSR